MIIDFHTHMFQNTSGIGKEPGMVPATDGTVEGTKKKMAEWGVAKAVVQHIAPNAGDSRRINQFAKELASEGVFYSFGAFHPDDPVDDLKELKESGIFYGVKLHPYIQRFEIDENKMYPVYEELSSLKLPVLFHTGFDPFGPESTGAYAERIHKIHKEFPDLTIIGAHLGAMKMYDEAEKYLIGTDIYLDVSDSVKFCEIKQYERIIKKHDPDKILFGSDCPMGNPQEELSYLERLNLGSELMEKILHKNAEKLLGIIA